MKRREKLVAAPLEGYEPEVGAALWRLDEGRERTLRVLEDLPEGCLDAESGGNTIGTVLYHVALIEADWLFVDILEQAIPPELQRVLPADDRDHQGVLTAVRGESIDQLLSRLDLVRGTLRTRLRGMTQDDFHRPRACPNYDVSPAWVLHHLAQHEAEHRGEIGSIISRVAQATSREVVRSEGFSLDEMVAAVRRASGQFVGLVRSLTPEEGQLPVPAMDWSVSQTASHLIGIVMRGTGDRRRAASVEALGQLNRQQIDELAMSDPAEIADRLEARLETQLGLLSKATGDEAFELHAGLVTDVRTALSYELCDFLLHGLDIARATGRPWTIDPADAALDLRALLPALEPWVRPEVHSGKAQEAEFSFPGPDRAICIEVGGGLYRVTTKPADGSAPEVDPVELLLAVSKRGKGSDPTVAAIASWYKPT
ncbi:MAG TPA: DinB family protein [Actinomycetota bacterium]|nr:DinB family protein [Actinomycetota bacterium]